MYCHQEPVFEIFNFQPPLFSVLQTNYQCFLASWNREHILYPFLQQCVRYYHYIMTRINLAKHSFLVTMRKGKSMSLFNRRYWINSTSMQLRHCSLFFSLGWFNLCILKLEQMLTVMLGCKKWLQGGRGLGGSWFQGNESWMPVGLVVFVTFVFKWLSFCINLLRLDSHCMQVGHSSDCAASESEHTLPGVQCCS